MTVNSVASLWNPILVPRYDGAWSTFTSGIGGPGNIQEPSRDSASATGSIGLSGSGAIVEGSDSAYGSSNLGQLAVGHFVPQKYSLHQVYPRPDSETGAFGSNVNARHRWAEVGEVYEITPKAFGGSPPFMYSIISQPSGESATIGNIYGDPSSHGVFRWIPSRTFLSLAPASFTIRITGQDGNFIDITWTVATTTFLYLSPSGNDTTGSGTKASPWRSLAKVMGPNKVTTTYPGRVVCMRGGSYATVAHTDAWDGDNHEETIKCRVELQSGRHPMTYMVYPGETATIDFSGAEITGGLSSGGSPSDDLLFSGSSTSKLVISGSATNAAERHNFWFMDSARIGFQWVDFDGFIPLTSGLNQSNSAPIFSSGSDTTPTRQYYHLHNVREINRTLTDPHVPPNDGVLWVMFGIAYWVDEYCTGSRSTGTAGAAFKDTCYNTSTRYADIATPVTTDGNFSLNYMHQSAGGNNEVCFSRLTGGPLWFNQQLVATGPIHSYRNTIYTIDQNGNPGIRAYASSSQFTSTNDCIISNGGPYLSSGGGYPDFSGVVVGTGTECHVSVSSTNKPFNVTTGQLQNVSGGTAWRDLYLGRRGREIA